MPYARSGRVCTAYRHLTTPWAGPVAQRFRADPYRQLDANLAVLASYTRPEDVLLDVGGGAGRVALPQALRCREVVVVDASPAAGAEFTAAAAAAGIANARFVHANWLGGGRSPGRRRPHLKRDLLRAEIVPFITKLATTRRRVMITVWSVVIPTRARRSST